MTRQPPERGTDDGEQPGQGARDRDARERQAPQQSQPPERATAGPQQPDRSPEQSHGRNRQAGRAADQPGSQQSRPGAGQPRPRNRQFQSETWQFHQFWRGQPGPERSRPAMSQPSSAGQPPSGSGETIPVGAVRVGMPAPDPLGPGRQRLPLSQLPGQRPQLSGLPGVLVHGAELQEHQSLQQRQEAQSSASLQELQSLQQPGGESTTSGADQQPRDPETGQFLSKDERG